VVPYPKNNARAVTAWARQTVPRQALQASFTPRRSKGRDESASYMTAELCACARAMGCAQRGVADTNPTGKSL
jgi:hypothetical protein